MSNSAMEPCNGLPEMQAMVLMVLLILMIAPVLPLLSVHQMPMVLITFNSVNLVFQVITLQEAPNHSHTPVFHGLTIKYLFSMPVSMTAISLLYLLGLHIVILFISAAMTPWIYQFLSFPLNPVR